MRYWLHVEVYAIAIAFTICTLSQPSQSIFCHFEFENPSNSANYTFFSKIVDLMGFELITFWT